MTRPVSSWELVVVAFVGALFGLAAIGMVS
jgi:hypothetical protein